MTGSRTYRALSLDLWFTVLTYGADSDRQWQDARMATLSRLLRRPDGSSFSRDDLARALQEITKAHGEAGYHSPISLEPGAQVRRLAGALGGRLTVPETEAGRLYSDAGLEEAPPEVNPEVVPLLRSLAERGVPVVLVSNTGRRSDTWTAFLSARGVPPIREIVTSCEVGHAKPRPEIFHAAASRLGVEPQGILHVGDRWDLDVRGALAAGCGAALYRGLWKQYPPDEVSDSPVPAALPPSVMLVDHLSELLDPKLWSVPYAAGR